MFARSCKRGINQLLAASAHNAGHQSSVASHAAPVSASVERVALIAAAAAAAELTTDGAIMYARCYTTIAGKYPLQLS